MNKIIALLALVVLVGGGCHRKAVPTKSTGPGTSVAVAKVEPSVKAKNTDFLFFQAKGRAQVELKGNKQGANVSVRLRRDSIIWVSASLVGIEGVRAILTPDSVRVVNRLQKTYFSGGYDFLSKLLNVPVSYEQMQALLLGDYQPAPAGTKPTIVEADGGAQRVSYPLAGVLVERLLQVGSGRVQELTMTDEATKRSLVVQYSDFQPIVEQNNMPFAYTTAIQAKQANGATSATLNYNKVDAGRERLSFPFAVPKGYTRMKSVSN